MLIVTFLKTYSELQLILIWVWKYDTNENAKREKSTQERISILKWFCRNSVGYFEEKISPTLPTPIFFHAKPISVISLVCAPRPLPYPPPFLPFLLHAPTIGLNLISVLIWFHQLIYDRSRDTTSCCVRREALSKGRNYIISQIEKNIFLFKFQEQWRMIIRDWQRVQLERALSKLTFSVCLTSFGFSSL